MKRFWDRVRKGEGCWGRNVEKRGLMTAEAHMARTDPMADLGVLWRDSTATDRIRLPHWDLVGYRKTESGWVLDESRAFRDELGEEDDHDRRADGDLDSVGWETVPASDRVWVRDALKTRLDQLNSLLSSGPGPYLVQRSRIKRLYYEMKALLAILAAHEVAPRDRAVSVRDTVASRLLANASDPLSLDANEVTWLRDQYQDLWDYLRGLITR